MSKIFLVLHALLGKVFSIVGYVMGASFLFTTILAFSMPVKDGQVSSIFIFGGLTLACAGLVAAGLRIKRRIQRFKEYVHLISQKKKTLLADMAKETGKTVEFIKNDLQTMIKLKYFANAHIDEAGLELVVDKPFDGVDVTGIDMETVVCKGCGASVFKRRNTVVQCEYCGSAIV